MNNHLIYRFSFGHAPDMGRIKFSGDNQLNAIGAVGMRISVLRSKAQPQSELDLAGATDG
jgi:hypothetical protein